MSLSAKRESLTRIHGRYQRAGRPHKSRILDGFCAVCGSHRKAALRPLNRPLPTTPPKRSGPKTRYDPVAVLPVLNPVWLASDQLCRKLLQVALPEWLEYYERRAAPLPEAIRQTSVVVSTKAVVSSSSAKIAVSSRSSCLEPEIGIVCFPRPPICFIPVGHHKNKD